MEYDLKRIINFAMLDINEKDYPYYKNEIDKVLKKVETLPKVNEEFSRVNKNDTMSLREDVIEPSLKPEEALKNAPQVEAGCFVVPRFMD